ncbi:MAG TPA: dihydrofolate reductase family protein [Candidatus Saccharimonadales bacterium]|nr:dihydrofolate reductase family protein [Candidatus Saccharimonadales bacterium]
MKVVLIAALTADGFIGRSTNELPTTWTSDEDRHFFWRTTKEIGVVIMGGNTFRPIGKALPKRRNIVYSRTPINVEGVETTQEPPADLLRRLEAEGHTQVAICGGSKIYDMFLQASLVDELYLTIEPQLFGAGVPLSVHSSDHKLKLLACTKLSDDVVLLHYEVTT